MAPSKMHCCVPQCNSSKNKHIPGFSMHIFPKEKKLRLNWIQKLKIGKKLSLGNSARVCCLHFNSTDFFFPELACSRRRLKKGVVPSQNLPVTSLEQKGIIRKKEPREPPKRHVLNKRNDTKTDKAEGETDLGEELVTEQEAEVLQCPAQTQNIQFDNENLENPRKNLCTCDVTSKVHADASCQADTYTESNVNILNIIKTDKDLYRMCGLPSFEVFRSIVDCFNKIFTVKTQLPSEGLVVLVLLKMKLNLYYSVISTMFRIPESTCRRYFQQAVFALAEVLQTVIEWPSKEEIAQNIPSCFKGFENVKVVLDCTEIPVEKPRCLRCSLLCYSFYKGCPTAKFLIGVSPAGSIIFVSDAYGGRASDKFITNESKVLDKLTPYIESCMVDKGFHLDDECYERGIELVRPPFVRKKKTTNRQ